MNTNYILTIHSIYNYFRCSTPHGFSAAVYTYQYVQWLRVLISQIVTLSDVFLFINL